LSNLKLKLGCCSVVAFNNNNRRNNNNNNNNDNNNNQFNTQVASVSSMQDVVSRSLKVPWGAPQEEVCHGGEDVIPSEVMAALNVSSIFVRAWLQASTMTSRSCITRAVCEARDEADSLGIVAALFSEIFRCVHYTILS
jgi:hypothetical protein